MNKTLKLFFILLKGKFKAFTVTDKVVADLGLLTSCSHLLFLSALLVLLQLHCFCCFRISAPAISDVWLTSTPPSNLASKFTLSKRHMPYLKLHCSPLPVPFILISIFFHITSILPICYIIPLVRVFIS